LRRPVELAAVIGQVKPHQIHMSGNATNQDLTEKAGIAGRMVMTMGSPWDGNASHNGYPPFDGIGRGQQQQAMNGSNFPSRLNSATGTAAWPQQYLEPVYLWMNSINGATELSIRDYTTTQNIDVFADNASCGGSGCSSLTTGT
jgi:hypothetical protein